MKLYTFEINGQRHIGAEHKGQLIDLKAAHAALVEVRHLRPGARAAMPSDMLAFVRAGDAALRAARETIDFMGRRPAVPLGVELAYPMDTVKVIAPVPRPCKILCSGINYRSHQQENPQATLPTEPFFFAKLPSAVVGPEEAIVLPKASRQVDYEIELAVVIGHKMKDTPEDQILSGIFGYTILHDVSARDVQFKDNQITLGKNFDTFCPMGPCIVTSDELPKANELSLKSFLNNELMQNGTTKDWVFSLPFLLSWLSHHLTLEPGDVVSTGTPAGVGVFRKPPVFLKPGDTVRLEIDGIGMLRNPVVAAE